MSVIEFLCLIKVMDKVGRCLAQLVEHVSHVLSLCGGPRFDFRPGSFCCVSLPLSLSMFPVTLFSWTINKAIKNAKKL